MTHSLIRTGRGLLMAGGLGLALVGIVCVTNPQREHVTEPRLDIPQLVESRPAIGDLHATGGYRKFLEPQCRWCGSAVRERQVHHIIPQSTILRMFVAGEISLERAKALLDTDRSNFVTFCDRCHFVVGHQCNWHNDVTNLPAVLQAAGKE